ncbi:glycosyltransferase [Arthrobacter globiformis]|uniref:glycosyltransferase n=1 Tax=Arthrobacter globiformis TaxID=1665 RepID=UPI00397A3DFB
MSGLIVHEWLEKHGGAETVVEQFAELYPAASIFCLWDDFPERFPNHEVRESWLASTPLRRRKPLALPWMLPTWRRIPVSEADWILCSSHLFAHHARLLNRDVDVPKFVYTHTPARYIWNPELDHRGESRLVRAASAVFRGIDRRRAAEAVSIAANSKFVQERINATWDRPSVVINPPVDTKYFSDVPDSDSDLRDDEKRILDELPRQFILGASRFVPYKGLDKVIAAGEAANLPVVLAGEGPHYPVLQQLATEARVPVQILRAPSRPFLRALYQRAMVYVFPAIEDFGIMPVEAMATGTPVVANRLGGAGESVVDRKSGILLDDFGPRELKAAVSTACGLDESNISARAKDFDLPVFRKRVADWMKL